MKTVSIVFFEDSAARHLEPLTLTRPVHDLRVGLLTIRERWERALGITEATGPLRPHLRGLFPAPSRRSAAAVWLNARYLPTPELVAAIGRGGFGHLRAGDDLVATEATASESTAWLATGLPDPRGRGRKPPGEPLLIRYPWDISRLAAAGIVADAAVLGWPAGRGPGCHPAAIVDGADRLLMHPEAVIEPGAMPPTSAWCPRDAT